MQYFINGAQYAFSTSLGAAIPVTAISNAKPAVAVAGAPPANGSILVISSGWSSLNGTVARSAAADPDSFELEGVDTTSLVRYPAGLGSGSVKVAGGFLGLSQVRNIEKSGGEQGYYTFGYVDDPSNRDREKPTVKSPLRYTFSVDYDPALPWYQALQDADYAQQPIVVRETLPTGDLILYYGFPSFDKVPTKTRNENMQNTLVIACQCEPIRYGVV